ncbi:hypothetical protein, partial [Ureaplasma diversum]|uniref:hypothetical protein n=1 Tax=Ureaplasma diversum TaxID=42094 RepID=UPI000570A828
KKALALSVGAIMAGVSVIGVVAACAPTKAKPNKPSQGTQNPSQSGGTESTNPGSGNTTNPSGQGSNNGGTTTTPSGSNNKTPETTQPSTPQSSPKDGNGSDSMSKPQQPQVESQPKDSEKKEGDTSTPGTSDSEKSKTETEKNEMPKVDAEPNKTPETGDTNPDKKTGTEDGTGTNKKPKTGNTDETSEKTQSEEDKLKAQKEAEAKQKDAAVKALQEKKAATKKEVEELTNIPEERLTKYTEDIDKIVDPSESEKLTNILSDAKKEDEEYGKFEAKKEQAKQEISNLKNIDQQEKDKLLEELQKINEISKTQDIDTILNKARNQDATKIDSELTISLVGNNSLERKADKYLYLTVKTSVDNYQKIKEKRFVMSIEKDVGQFHDETTATFDAQGKTIYHENPKTEGGFVTFTLSSSLAYKDSEKGKYKVVELYLAGDTNKKNLLQGQSNTITI